MVTSHRIVYDKFTTSPSKIKRTRGENGSSGQEWSQGGANELVGRTSIHRQAVVHSPQQSGTKRKSSITGHVRPPIEMPTGYSVFNKPAGQLQTAQKSHTYFGAICDSNDVVVAHDDQVRPVNDLPRRSSRIRRSPERYASLSW